MTSIYLFTSSQEQKRTSCKYQCNVMSLDHCVQKCETFMEKIENVVSIADVGYILLIIFTTIFIINVCCRRRKLSMFAWVQLLLLTVFNMVAVSREFIDHLVPFMQLHFVEGILEVLFASISLNFAILYFNSVNIIYQFSKNGHLPTQRSNFRFKLWLILSNLIAFIGGLTIVFIINMSVLEDKVLRAAISYYFG